MGFPAVLEFSVESSAGEPGMREVLFEHVKKRRGA